MRKLSLFTLVTVLATLPASKVYAQGVMGLVHKPGVIHNPTMDRLMMGVGTATAFWVMVFLLLVVFVVAAYLVVDKWHKEWR